MCGIIIHYEDKGVVKSHILDVFEARDVRLSARMNVFLTLRQSHTGLYMAKILRDVRVELGIEGKVSMYVGQCVCHLTVR